MSQILENCSVCATPFLVPPSGGLAERTCHACGAEYVVACFAPALERPFPVERGEPAVSGNEACCFFHQNHIAAETCQTCGRLICRLCALNAAGRMFCPACLERATTQSEDPVLRVEFSRQDRIALALAVLPIGLSLFAAPALFIDTSLGIGMMAGLASAISFVTMPTALFLVVRNWRRQQTPWGRSRARFVVVGIVAGLQLCFWLVALAGAAYALIATALPPGGVS